MQVKTLATIAGCSMAALVGGTFLITQILAPSNELANCIGSRVAGGNIGGPFQLISGTGETVTDTDVLTDPALIYFGYTFCPDVCPLDVSRNAVVTDILADAGHKVTPVFITVDPERDTPEFVSDYAANHHPDMIGLSGSIEQIKQAASQYRVFFQKRETDDPDFYLMDHSSFTYFMMPDIGFVDFFRSDAAPEDIAKTVSCVIENS